MKKYYLLILLLIPISFLLYKLYYELHLPIRYPNFGIRIPAGYEIHGIDVSKYQANIDWNSVAEMRDRNAKVSFVFMKATQGTYLVDKQYKRNWKSSKKAGVIRGVYHYFDMRNNATKQADFFVKNVQLENGDLAPVLDIEETKGFSTAQIQEKCKIWLNLIENHYKIKPIIYTNVAFYDDYLGDDFDEYPLWVAHYKQPLRPRINRKWHFWQHNDNGTVNGILHPTDFNIFYGNVDELSEFRIKK